MSVESARVERRARQRFDVHLPLVIQVEGRTVTGFTQNASGGGLFFYTEAKLIEGTAVELTFTMPSEITLAEAMRVRCRGRVLRASQPQTGETCGIAVQLESYQYLPSLTYESAPLARVSADRLAPDNRESVPR